MATEKELEDWLSKAPKDFKIEPITLNNITDNVYAMGHILPVLVNRGYTIDIRINVDKWETKDG